MTHLRREGGYTLVDTLMAVALLGIMSSMAIPMADATSRGFRVKGDAHAIANIVSLAKMRAASRFTRARIRADLAASTFQLEVWDKTAAAWVTEGAVERLARGVTFGFSGLGEPPPNTQVAIGQSGPCTGTASLVDAFIADTACIVFNSRGVPIDNTVAGVPLGGNALYITDGSSVYATTVTATPLVRQWWSGARAAGWVRQ